MNILLERTAEIVLALTFGSAAAVSATPPSLVGHILDDVIDHYKPGYANCINARYSLATLTGWTQAPGSDYFISVLARMDCGFIQPK